MSMQPVFIDLAHHPTSGCSEVSHACQDTAIKPVGIQCRNATVAIANKSGLLSVLLAASGMLVYACSYQHVSLSFL